MNIIEIQDSLKDLPDSALMKEMQAPTGSAPQFLVLSELKRRKRMRDDFQRRQNADMKTVAEEVVTAAGAPQEGIMQMSRAMAPNSSIAQNTGMDMAAPVQPTQAPQMMADGGIMKLQRGGAISAQPTGQGGTYILVQDGEQVPGTGTYPDFRSANEAAKAIRDVPVFQRSRVLSDLGQPEPILETEVSALSQVDPDAMAFSANDEMRRQLQLRQARGQRDDAEVGGIASLDPLGRAFMDEYRPDMSVASSQEGIPEFGDAPYAQTNVADLLETMSKANEGIVRDELPASADDDLRFSRGTASSIAPSAGSDQIANMIAGSELSRLSGAIPLADAVSEMSGNAPIDFDASTPDPSIAPDVDLSRVVAAGSDGSVEPESGFFDFLPSLRTSDEDNPMVRMVEDAIDAYNAPEVRSPDDVIDAQRREAANTLSGSEFSLAPDQGYPFPVDAPEETSPETDPYNALNILPALTETSSVDEIVDKATEIMEERNIPLDQQLIDAGFTGGDIDPSDIPALTVPQQAAEEAGVSLDAFGGQGQTVDLGGDGSGGSSTTTPRGGANFGSIESRISQMLTDREKSAEADKWLALAQTGMALMASKNPTFGGALGEAGLLGVGAMQKARQQYDDDILGLLGMQQKVQTAKAAATKAGSSTKGLNQEIDDARAYLNGLQSEAKSYRRVAEGDETLGTVDRVIDMSPPDLKANIIAAEDRLNKLMELRSSLGTSTFDATK